MIWPFFDHLPTPTWTFITLNVDQNWHFLTTYPPHLVNVVFERPPNAESNICREYLKYNVVKWYRGRRGAFKFFWSENCQSSRRLWNSWRIQVPNCESQQNSSNLNDEYKNEAAPWFEHGISCLLDRRFNQLSHAAFAETEEQTFRLYSIYCRTHVQNL